MNKGFSDSKKGFNKTAIRYGIALCASGITFVIAFLFQIYSIKINLTILVVLALIIPSWYGGRGPGLLAAVLLVVTAIYISPKPADTTLANYIFTVFNVLFLCVVVVLLISSRKVTEAHLHEQRELWHTTLSSIGDAVISTDIGGKVKFINPIAERLTGWEMREADGKPLDEIFNLIDETTREPLENPVKRVLREETIVELDYDTILKARDGSEIPIEESSAPIRADGGEIVGVILAFRDISERKRLVESDKRLQQSQKMEAIGTLTGGVAHDFNNLLTAILGNTQIALMKIGNESPAVRHLKEIEEAGKRAAVLTKQLLAFSRQQRLERRTVNLNDTISEISRMLKRIIGEDVEISTRYAENLSLVHVDSAQIEQVIMNLAVNARDAMPDGGRISIETNNIELDESYCQRYPYIKPGKYVEIIVSDTGIGMNEATQAHIFEPFFTTKDIGKGTGLGLSMAYGIIKQHDGNINIYSELGHGSTFKVFLPVATSAAESQIESIKSTLEGGKETILIAEDEEILRSLASDILQGFGYTVLIAENGKQAVELYLQNRGEIDLLLFDVVMPVLGGAEAFEQIANTDEMPPPIIFMTGYSSEMVESRFVRQNEFVENAATVLQKPYNIEGLGRKVREVLDSKQFTKTV